MDALADALSPFHPAVAAWFRETFGQASPPQALGWPSISQGQHTLILAPTGSGKTLAAFLWCINQLLVEPGPGVRVVYVSPLKALNYDIHKNLELPLAGIAEAGRRLGLELPQISTAVRTGDTPSAERAAMLRHPPHVLITTPESLYLLLTAQRGREALRHVRYLILDEIHALAGTKRGVHLALSVERLEALVRGLPGPGDDPPPDPQPESAGNGAPAGLGDHHPGKGPAGGFVRIGLSATQRPLSEVAAFLGGSGRAVTIVDAGVRKALDLAVVSPVEDFKNLPEQSSWNGMYQKLLEYVSGSAGAVLIFVNNRGVAERVTAHLNDLAGEEVARPHHGSLSKEQRRDTEEALKVGRVKAIVATSSLELGIDMGSIDLVIQVGSPKSTAHGLQRIGRAGHALNEVSAGRILPSFRSDLLEAAVLAREMHRANVEETAVPRNCLDVLAQQVCAMAALDEWPVPQLLATVRQAYPYAELTRGALEGVLEMLSGRYPSTEFRELRPRIAWDRVRDTVHGRDGTRLLATVNGGTIPDRGYFGVYLAESGTKLGELDEEMVFESRVGDVFILGNSNWRVQAIGHDRVLVSPAPPGPARLPFWHGDGPGRPYEVGRLVAEFQRDIEPRLADPTLPGWLAAEYDLDGAAARNLIDFLAEQRAAAGWLAAPNRIPIERFTDELGQPRVVIHSPYGRRVNGAWALALAAVVRGRTGIDVEHICTDDGIALRFPEGVVAPEDVVRGVTSAGLEDLLVEELSRSAMFGSVFRENATRSLLMPRQSPRRRTPLWLQRIKAADLLQVARKYASFPVVIETYRECLRDLLDVEHLRSLLGQIELGAVELVEIRTAAPSPFAADLLFSFIAAFMYASDAPRAERAGAMLSLNRDLLSEVIDAKSLRELIEPAAIRDLDGRLQRTLPGWKAESADELMEALLRLVDLSPAEVDERCEANGAELLRELLEGGQVVSLMEGQRAGAGRFIPAEYAGWCALALSGEPGETQAAARLKLVEHYAAAHGPFFAATVSARYGFDPQPQLQALLAAGRVALGGFTPGATGEEWCLVEHLRQLHRRSLSILREQIEPREPEQFAAFLLEWQHVSGAAKPAGLAGLRQVLEQLQGLPLAMELWEPEVLHRRLEGYQPAWLDQLCASGEVVWLGSTTPGGGKGRIALYSREDLAALGVRLDSGSPRRLGTTAAAAPAADARAGGPLARSQPASLLDDSLAALPNKLSPAACAARHWLRVHGASFLQDVALGCALSMPKAYNALWELVWAGQATNDTFDPVRSPRRPMADAAAPALNPRSRWTYHRDAGAKPRLPVAQGRWSLPPEPEAAPPEDQAEAWAQQLLQRYGIVAREMALAEGRPWPALYQVLKRREALGHVRRGYFVKGLSGAQFALPAAVEQLRQPREGCVLVNATDPAQAYGGVLRFPGERRVTRLPSNWLGLLNGCPALAVEGQGRDLVPLNEQALEALPLLPTLLGAPASVRRIKRLEVETWDGQPVAGSPAEAPLAAAGFESDPRRMVLRPSRL
ncbi:MAG TPA: DEAD/DEAH box helicase [Chloroflexota bacterium]|nr:DEAD/DEAH box helicase [Chloroflexota bacterium]